MAVIKREQVHESGTYFLQEGEVVSFPPPSPHQEAIASQHPPSILSHQEQLERMTEEVRERKLAQVREEAHRIVEEAKGKIQVLREAAQQEGREAGRAELAHQIDQVFSAINEASQLKKKILKETEPEILRLALRVAEQIIRSEVSLHRDVCLNIVSDAIGRITDREQITLKVNHEDVEVIKQYKDRIAGIVDGVKRFSIVEDTQVDAGGCVIETSLGYVDARIATKISLIETAWAKLLEEDKGHPGLEEEGAGEAEEEVVPVNEGSVDVEEVAEDDEERSLDDDDDDEPF